MDEEELKAYVAALEDRLIELNKKKQRNRLLTNFMLGLVPAIFFVIWALCLR